MNLKGGPLRVLGSSNCIDSAECLMDIYTDLKCKRKLLMQREFFVNEEMKLTAPETAEEIAYKSFEKLGISQYDGSIVLDGFPTLKKLITTSKEEMSDNSPADQKSIEKLTNFFSAKY